MTVGAIPLHATLHAALLDAFTLADLDRMMRYELERVREHYTTANGLIRIVDDLLQVSSREGWLVDLFDGAARFNTTNPRLQAAVTQLRALHKAPEPLPARSSTAMFAATDFSVGSIAAQTALGGALGWSVAGLILGLLLGQESRLALAAIGAVAGALSGYLGGGLVGLLTGAIVRRVAPRFARTQLRRIGSVWALATLGFLLVGGLIGLALIPGVIDDMFSGADSVGAVIGALVAALVVAALILLIAALLAAFLGSALIGALIGRYLRLSADGISRTQAVQIALSWIACGFGTLLLLLILLATLSPA